jgi:hypothetical protein
MLPRRIVDADERMLAYYDGLEEHRINRPRHERVNSLMGWVQDSQPATWSDAVIRFSRSKVGSVFTVDGIIFHNLLSAECYSGAALLSRNGEMARQILGMSLRRSQMRLGSLQARREQFWRFTDSLREHSGFLQERDFDRRVRSITRLADDLRHRVKRWPQTPDSHFYGGRNELMYQDGPPELPAGVHDGGGLHGHGRTV